LLQKKIDGYLIRIFCFVFHYDIESFANPTPILSLMRKIAAYHKQTEQIKL